MLCSLICVVKSWLRSLTLFDRNALKKYCNDLRNYPAVTEDCVVSEKDGWSFMPIDALHVVCIPPWRELNPFYEPLLGYKNGNEVRIKNTLFNSSNSLPGPSRNQNAEKRQIDATNAAEKRRNTDCEIDETAFEEEEVTSENGVCKQHLVIYRLYTPSRSARFLLEPLKGYMLMHLKQSCFLRHNSYCIAIHFTDEQVTNASSH